MDIEPQQQELESVLATGLPVGRTGIATLPSENRDDVSFEVDRRIAIGIRNLQVDLGATLSMDDLDRSHPVRTKLICVYLCSSVAN